MGIGVKICGLTTAEAVEVAVREGADFLGFVDFPASPRHVEPERVAQLLSAADVKCSVVSVIVDADNNKINNILSIINPNYLQLHGGETLERVREIKSRFGCGIIKAFKVRSGDDVARAREYQDVADMLLFDARAPEGGLPGGNGLAFDWQLLAGRWFSVPCVLSGGLNAENVAEAVQITGAKIVDVSSSLESAPGIKDVGKIREFFGALRGVAGGK